MAGNNSYTAYNSYETSWADQWDSNPTYEYSDKKSGNNGSSKFSNKVGDTFGKTKSVASTGVKKIKAVYNSNETSWADQWDPEPASYDKKSTGNNNSSKISSKVGDTFGKTKSVASTGVKKVKSGASAGFQWIKDKCHKPNQERLGQASR
ncbi:hypothetical protein K7X08_021046 [Anisodus acutangulus]|uniref:Uncharacterized protein n=1 Tax=Anisodus acutangulus TaxID=402998 RepID=A0A9Q1LYM1_9SOLA|nr:hypothetical protein K7X08_021046 [Anisodus acutangulus]